MEYFVAVAEELHFGRAARRLHMSQPPLSTQIQRLEQEVGVRLLRRTKRSVELTAAGEVFLGEARATLRQAARAGERARAAARGELGRLDLGVVDAALYGVAPELIRRFTERCPQVELTVSERRGDEQLALIEEGRLHAGILHPPAHRPEVAVMELHTEPYVLALPEGHPLAAREGVTLAEACAQPLIQAPRSVNPEGYDSVIAACRERGLRPRIAREASPKQTIIALVAAGLGASVVPAALRRHPYPGVVYRPIEDAGFVLTTALAWRRRDPEPTVTALAEVARSLRAEWSRAEWSRAEWSRAERDGGERDRVE
ncbi:LysR family transcriptional regulator [Nonomuraea candida]|uniref:LysR family transcriptional regulator n=1 Tax=Nonomuraea candida TaxID=359159 RepID=UPI0007C81439|nr:LysR family transcriptional regulator [Nonomuraea candida]